MYRQPWKDGKVIGTPQVALKLPFTFPLNYGSTYMAWAFNLKVDEEDLFLAQKIEVGVTAGTRIDDCREVV